MLKLLRVSTQALSCEGIRHIEVTEALDVAVTYDDNRTFVLQPRNRYTDYPGELSEYIRPKLISRIIYFLRDEYDSSTGYTLRSSYSFDVEDAIQEIISRFYGNQEVKED